MDEYLRGCKRGKWKQRIPTVMQTTPLVQTVVDLKLIDDPTCPDGDGEESSSSSDENERSPADSESVSDAEEGEGDDVDVAAPETVEEVQEVGNAPETTAPPVPQESASSSADRSCGAL